MLKTDARADRSMDPLAEVKAMQKLAEAVAGLEPEATARVLRWAADHYGVSVGRKDSRPGVGSASAAGQELTGKFADLAELYSATSPANDADKALVVGYWVQFGEGQADFGSQEINKTLKNLGHGVSNITSAFDTLKARKPASVIQLKKAGTSKQARKTYKLTAAGKSAVELMVGAD